jgi:hypothetical protein
LKMAYGVTTAKLSGNPDPSGWSQVYDFKPQESEKLLRRGHLFALISTSWKEEGLDTVVAGREIISRLHEEYFGKLEEKPFMALKEATEKVIGEYSSQGSVEIAAVAVVDSTIYTAVGGGASAFLFRKGRLFKLLESMPGLVIAASGNPSDEDRIIIGTKAFFGLFSREEIGKSLKAYDPSSAVESYAPLVHSQKSEGACGVFILRFDKVPETEEIKPILKEQKKDKGQLKDGLYVRSENAFKKAKRGVSDIFKKQGEGIYLKDEGLDGSVERNKKTSLLVGVLLLLILTVSIFFGIQQKKKADFRSTYESQLSSAEHELQESYSLYLLNPQRSRELFEQARGRVLGLSVREIDDPNLEILRQKIAEGEEKILGHYSVELDLFVDLGLFSEGFKVDDVSVSSETAYILDGAGGRIIKVSLSNKRTETYAGPSDVRKASVVASYSGRVFVSGDDGLYELDNGRIRIDDGQGKDVFITAYAGNLYLLDNSLSKIFRYPAATTGFGNRGDWLRSGTQVDLYDAHGLIIDGMIWTVVGQNRVMKFSLGNPVNFTFKGVFPEIERITDIFTNEESESLYILESGRERVVVVGKDGEYKAQYSGEDMKDALRLVVSEKEKKGFVLTSDKLLFFDLRHLD